MSVITTLELPGVSNETYAEIGRHIGAAGPPDGIEFHACGPAHDGWRVVDVWSSEQDWHRFLDEVYLPAAAPYLRGAPRRSAMLAQHAGEVRRPA